jgi:hypothetical protein
LKQTSTSKCFEYRTPKDVFFEGRPSPMKHPFLTTENFERLSIDEEEEKTNNGNEGESSKIITYNSSNFERFMKRDAERLSFTPPFKVLGSDIGDKSN